MLVQQASTEDWDRVVRWTISCFGFRKCPIFYVDLDNMSNLKCFAKDGPTILSRSRRPTAIPKDPPNIDEYLPPTDAVQWVWRTKKCSAITRDTIPWELVEMSTDRTVSNLCRRNRERRLQEVEDRTRLQEWGERCRQKHIAEVEAMEEERLHKNVERERVRKEMEVKESAVIASQQRKQNVCDVLSSYSVKIEKIETGKYKLLGFRATTNSMRVVLEADNGVVVSVFTNTQLRKILQRCKHCFEKEKDKLGRETYWLPTSEMQIEIGKKQPLELDGKTIHWYPVRVLVSPGPKIEYPEDPEILPWEEVPPGLEKVDYPKTTTKIKDLPEGEYKVQRYAERMYRGKKKTCLFLYNKDTEETPCYGFFLQKASEKVDLQKSPMIRCQLGPFRTNPWKEKDRIVAILDNDVSISCT